MKTIFITAPLFLIIVFLIYIVPDSEKIKEPQISSQEENIIFDQNSFEQRPRAYLLEYLKNIGWQKTEEFFPSIDLDSPIGRVYAAYYLPNNPETVSLELKENYNHPEEEVGKTRPGVIVFRNNNNKLEIVWESKEFLSSARPGKISFQDINNDKQKELILEVGQGVRLVPAFWIYMWNGNEFVLMNPNQKAEDESERWMAGIDVQLHDLENDGTLEVITLNETGNYGDTHQYARIFKFNGTEYYLWKEVAESSPEFKELFK